MGCYGCSENAFSCEDLDINSKSSCFSKEQRCNNIMDCPNNRDEIDCNMLSPSLHNNPLFATSNTEGFLQRNFKGEWYAVCKNPYMWAHDTCRRETGLIIRPPYIQVLPVDPLLRLGYLNTGPEGMIHTSNTCFNSSAIYVTCPELLCGTRISSTSQLMKENSAIENHLFGRNKRFLLNGRPYPMSFYDPLKRNVRNNVLINEQKESKKVMSKTKRAQARVVGGRPSKPAAWPWMAALYRNGMFHCGGVIVTQHWVLSAAHCVHEFWSHYYEVQVGMLRRFSFSPQEQNHRITHVIVNQNYDQADMKNDLSLLRVKSSIQFSRWVRPICLPGPNTAGPEWRWGPAPGTVCTAVGWGATVEHGPDPDHMREVELPIWAKCKHSEDRDGKEICAGLVEGGKDACQGDSGGPLVCRSPLNSQQWYVAGIVSHGDGCARKGEPGVYTRVSLFVKWIRYHIGSKILPTIQPQQKCPGFKCTSGLSKCLPDKRVCDKIVDCLDGEDEMNCNSMRSFDNIFLARTSSDNTNANPSTARESNNNDSVKKFQSSESSDKEQWLGNEETAKKQLNDDMLHASTIEISIPNSSEHMRDNSEQDIDPPSFGRESDFIAVSSQNSHPLESRSSLLEKENINDDEAINMQSRASDIQEDWATTPPSESSTIMSSMSVKTNSPITEQTTSTMPITTPLPVLSTTSSMLETTSILDAEQSKRKINNREDDESESKSLLVELLPHSENVDDESEKITGESNVIEKKEISPSAKIIDDFSSKKISTFDDKLDIIHKIEDLVLSELQPAKIRKKHLTPKEFECRRIYQTIPYSHRCDHKADCEDGTDELSCTCADYLHAFDDTLLCDGIFDCADGQDEADCFSCPEDRFLCRKSQICLPMKHVCDGKPQCPQGEDEVDCFALSNGKELKYDIDERPKTRLEGYLTKKQKNKWQIICEDNLSTEQQELAAAHICHYLGFSSANRYLLKHLNIDESILKSNEFRKRRDTSNSAPVHFTYRESSSSEDNARHIVIKEPQLLKEKCLPNIKKTCMSLYVYCDHSLFTDFDFSPNLLYSRAVETTTNEMWPWVAKVYVEGNYKCTGVLVDLQLVLVSHSCLWDSSMSRHHITVVLGSHRTLNATHGPYEQILPVDGKRDMYRSNVALLHLKEPAQYSTMVKPMVVQSTVMPENRNSTCVAVGQDGKNKTISVFVEETRENCHHHNKCFKLRSKSKSLCLPGMVSSQQWAGIISCHSERGWYPAATFVDIRGECGLQDRIIGTGIEDLKIEIQNAGINGALIKKQDLADKCHGIRCGRGKCIDLLHVCNGVRDCEDGGDESEESCKTKHLFCEKDPYDKNCECSTGQFRCHNGVCISKEQFNDGKDDCGDGTDEPEQLSCAKYLARVMPSRLCDGVIHCKDRSDEDPMFCKCFAKHTYQCGRTADVEHCVAPDVVCDGINDCPNGEDESTCVGLYAPQGTGYGKGQVIVRSHGVWHTKCYPNKKHSKSELEAICRELGFISGHAKELEISNKFKPHPYNNVLVDPFSDVLLNNRTQVKLRNSHAPLARAIFDDQLNNCHPVFIECM
ncbi:serine protease nudel [Ostrinia nubilalis]|uniref:serine protease nudel n=1 Tax=Ostrinia nubilalis TaxID=29057 RepID=UPI0030822CA8